MNDMLSGMIDARPTGLRPRAVVPAGSPGRPEAPRLAVIGCGAIAQSLYLPALARHPEVRAQAKLVDPEFERARALSERYGFGGATADYRELLDEVDAAIVAAPHHLHYPIALELLRQGKSVLCEKPLSETAEEARTLVNAARESGARLAVNHTRRLFPAYRRVAELLRDDAIGCPVEIEMLWGEVFDWPAATGSYFGKRGAGRGVLLDKGPHLIDVICWWLGTKPRVVRYRDDSFGGSEAVAEASLETERCSVTLSLSWLSRYSSGYRVRGERGELRGGIYDWRTLELRKDGGSFQTVHCASGASSPVEIRYEIIDDFLDVLRAGGAPIVPGEDALPSIEIIEECYRVRERFPLSWHQPVRLGNE